MTLQLQAVEAHESVQQNFDQIARVLIDTGGRQVGIRVGTATVSFSGSVTGTVTVPHGLGRTPAAVFSTGSGASQVAMTVPSGSVDAATFTLTGRYTDDIARTSTETAFWLAVG